MSTDGQRTKWHSNIAKNFNRLSSARERYNERQTADGRTTTYSERLRSLKTCALLSIGSHSQFSLSVRHQNNEKLTKIENRCDA